MRILGCIALLLVLTLALAVAGCGEDSSESTAATASPATPSASDTAAGGKVSANNATAEELEAAFEAAGVSNAKALAHEVEHNRPFAVDDTDFTKLRRGLAEHNAAPEVVDAIIAKLKLP